MAADLRRPDRSALETGVLIGVSLAALLLTISELTTLFTIHTATQHGAVRSVGGGSDNHYAMIPIALLALVMGAGVWHRGSRLALLVIVLLGVLALVIALAHDLHDAHRSGLIQPSPGQFQFAKASPSGGLYMETLGAVLLFATGVIGLLLAGAPGPRAPRAPRSPQTPRKPQAPRSPQTPRSPETPDSGQPRRRLRPESRRPS